MSAVRRCEMDRALLVVRRSGVADDLEELLRPAGTGRPRGLTCEAFLVGLLLAAAHKKALTLKGVWEVLTCDLTHSAQLALGTRTGTSTPGGRSRPITLRQVRYLLAAIDARLAHTEGQAPDLSEDERQARAGELQRVLDRLLAATMPTHLTHTGAYAVDETAVWSWARGSRAARRVTDSTTDDGASTEPNQPGAPDKADKGRVSKDPDARWGYRTAKLGERSMFFGYSVFAATRIPQLGAPGDTGPKLVERISVVPAATDVVAPALSIIDRLKSDRRAVTEVVADRAWSYKLPHRWADQLRARGVTQVLDLHPNDQGATDFEGMRMVAGTPHCPAMPDHLVTITRPATLGDGPQLDAFLAQVEARRQYALRRIAGPNPAGKERYRCPALDGRVQCALRGIDPDVPATVPLVANAPAATTAPSCCTHATVPVPAEAFGKLAQRHYWGSRKWVRSWRRRSTVEGSFGNLKNRNTENVTRGWAQVTGLVKTSLLLAAKVAVSNLRLLRVWAARTRDFTDPASTPDPEFHGFEELPAPTPANAAGAETTIGPPVLVTA